VEQMIGGRGAALISGSFLFVRGVAASTCAL
jgi:hypothetical protein